MSQPTLESILQEKRLFPPPPAFAQQARITPERYEQLCQEAERDPLRFWEQLARQELHWFKPWEQVLQWDPPQAQWFVGEN